MRLTKVLFVAVLCLTFSNIFAYDNIKFKVKKECDLVISNDIIESCYDTKLKAVRMVKYTIDGKKAYLKNIEKRPTWKYNKNIPKNERSTNGDYYKSGFDRSHLAFDSAYDYDYDTLKIIYDLNINAIPMYPRVNRYSWKSVEIYAMIKAVEFGKLDVIDYIVYPQTPKVVGNGVCVSSGFYKILINDENNFYECYYYKNDNNIKFTKYDKHKISCENIEFKLK